MVNFKESAVKFNILRLTTSISTFRLPESTNQFSLTTFIPRTTETTVHYLRSRSSVPCYVYSQRMLCRHSARRMLRRFAANRNVV